MAPEQGHGAYKFLKIGKHLGTATTVPLQRYARKSSNNSKRPENKVPWAVLA